MVPDCERHAKTEEIGPEAKHLHVRWGKIGLLGPSIVSSANDAAIAGKLNRTDIAQDCLFWILQSFQLPDATELAWDPFGMERPRKWHSRKVGPNGA